MEISTGDRYVTCYFCGITYHQNHGHNCTATEKTAWKITNSPKLNPNDVADPCAGCKNNVGWICPCCGKANAPWNPSCDCKGGVGFTVTNTSRGEVSDEERIL